MKSLPLEEAAFDPAERCDPDRSGGRVKTDHLARYHFASSYSKPGVKVADVGCGEGYGSQLLQSAGGEVTGFDIEEGVMAAARVKYPAASFKVAKATQLPVADNYFDVVVAFEVWHHLPDWPLFLIELKRILKPGGQLILSVPNQKIIYLNPWTKKFLTPYYQTNFTRQKMTKLVSEHFAIEAWYGQRFVKSYYANVLARLLFYIGSLVSSLIEVKANQMYKLADGPAVKPLTGDNARSLIVLAHKTL